MGLILSTKLIHCNSFSNTTQKLSQHILFQFQLCFPPYLACLVFLSNSKSLPEANDMEEKKTI